MSLSPVILFTYNRPRHTEATLAALANNEMAAETDLVIFSDGATTASGAAVVEEVRAICRNVQGFRSVRVVERQTNVGLANNIIDGVSEVLATSDRIIVLEDDLLTSRYFLRYMNEGLTTYATDEAVASIHGYLGPVNAVLPETFFLRGADCWGWATWRRAWKHFESDGARLLNQLEARNLSASFDLGNAYPYTQMLRDQIAGRNNSWAIRWHASAFLNNMFTLHPGRTLVVNTGGDGSGTHSGFTEGINGSLSDTPVEVHRQPVLENASALQAMSAFYKTVAHPGLRQKAKMILKKIGKRIMTSPKKRS